MSKSSTTGRFVVTFIGLTLGTIIGFNSLSDYQIIKKLPPPPLEFNEDGTPKKVPFKVRFRDTQPLELKPEVLAKRKEAEAKFLAEQQAKEASEAERK